MDTLTRSVLPIADRLGGLQAITNVRAELAAEIEKRR